jgi:hypothetical protein
MNAKAIKRGTKDAAVIILAPPVTIVAFGGLLAIGAGEWLRERSPVPVLRVLTWRKRRAWKDRHIPADPYPFTGLTPGDHLALAKYAGEIR